MSRFLVVESLLLASLLSLAGYVFWESWARTPCGATNRKLRNWGFGDFPLRDGRSRPLLSFSCPLLAVPMAANDHTFLLDSDLGRPLAPGAGGACPQPPGLGLVLGGPSPSTELGQVTVGALFLLSLALLAALQRVSELRRLAGRLRTLRLDGGEQERSSPARS